MLVSKKQTQTGIGLKELRNGEREAWAWGRVTGKWTQRNLKLRSSRNQEGVSEGN